ncbi:MAG: hypothetical protein AB9891_00485 [Anaerolineaceae bacterium]
MANRRIKRIPYKGAQLIDDAVMENQITIYELVEILKTSNMEKVEIYRQLGIVLDHLYKVSGILKSIPIELMDSKKEDSKEG